MFEHSIKVPRHYKTAAYIFKKVSTEGGSVKTLLYDNKLRHFRTNVLFALISETIKHSTTIDKVFENSSILSNEPRLDPWLAKVLTTELLYGKKALPGKSKPEQLILSYKKQFDNFFINHKEEPNTQGVQRPRYVRINTNLLTTSDAIGTFQEEGYRFIRCTSSSYDDYLKQIKGLGKYDFTQDFHLKTVFVFYPGTKFHEHELYLEHKIILQDKATAMAVHLLSPPQGSIVMDMCAAPGMKTTQLAAYMRNQGKIYAIERNEKRYQTLCEFVKNAESKCVQTIHRDTLDIKKGEFDDVEYILLDPSCSGSGMELCVHNYIEDSRLAKLTSLQEKFLKHAMNSFPKAKKIVYSTCSIFPEENERVIANVVKTSRSKWRVLDVKVLLKEQWNNFGSNMYGSIGSRCMYARSDSDLTTGFFLAVLERDTSKLNENKRDVNKEETSTIKLNKVSKKIDEQNMESFDNKNDYRNSDNTAENIILRKDRKKHKKRKLNIPQDEEHSNVNQSKQSPFNAIQSHDSKKKRKKRKMSELSDNVQEINEDESYENPIMKIKEGHIENGMATENEAKEKKKHKKIKLIVSTTGIENSKDQVIAQYLCDKSEDVSMERNKYREHRKSKITVKNNISKDTSDLKPKKKKKINE